MSATTRPVDRSWENTVHDSLPVTSDTGWEVIVGGTDESWSERVGKSLILMAKFSVVVTLIVAGLSAVLIEVVQATAGMPAETYQMHYDSALTLMTWGGVVGLIALTAAMLLDVAAPLRQ